MQKAIDTISNLYIQWKGIEPQEIDVLPESGSNRRYFRLSGENGETVIATFGSNIKENETFLYFSEHFRQKNLSVPKILAVNEDKTAYLQEDLGDVSLLNVLEAKGTTDELYGLFKKSLEELARMQVTGDKGLDYKRCLTNKEFGKQAIMADLLYIGCRQPQRIRLLRISFLRLYF